MAPTKSRLIPRALDFDTVRTTLVYTQVLVDPRRAEAMQKAFTLKPKSLRVAGSRGSNGEQLRLFKFAEGAAGGSGVESAAHEHRSGQPPGTI